MSFLDFNKYESQSSKRSRLIIKIILAVIILFGGAVVGYWFAGGFSSKSSKISTEKEFENYIDANIDRLKVELDCIVEQNIQDVEYLKTVTEHINDETAKLEKRLEKIVEYKEELGEFEIIIDNIDNDLIRFEPYAGD